MCKLNLTEEEKEITKINNIKDTKLFKIMLDLIKDELSKKYNKNYKIHLIGFNGILGDKENCNNRESNKKLVEYYKKLGFRKTNYYDIVCKGKDNKYIFHLY